MDLGYFELLFENITLLENLTQSVYVDSSIGEETAELNLKYSGTHDVKYEWDINTGLLLRKTVTAPSGQQLIVEPFTGPPREIIFIIIVCVIGIVIAIIFVIFKKLKKKNLSIHIK